MRKFLFSVFCIVSLSGCTAAALLDTASRNIFLREDVNLLEKNYAAADYLIGQALGNISKNTTIRAQDLVHANKSGITSSFGALVSDQVSSRIAQLGYSIERPDPEKPKMKNKNTRGALLTGTYMPNRQNASISLRLVDARTQQILGAFDYYIPLNVEISELLEDKPSVFRAR